MNKYESSRREFKRNSENKEILQQYKDPNKFRFLRSSGRTVTAVSSASREKPKKCLMSDVVMQNINNIQVGPGIWTKLCNEFHKEKYEMTMTYKNETKGADLSLAALYKERNQYKILSTALPSPSRKVEKLENNNYFLPNSQRRFMGISPKKNNKKKFTTLNSLRMEKEQSKTSTVLRFLNLKSFKNIKEMKGREDAKKLLEVIQTKMKLLHKPTLIINKKFNCKSSKRDWNASQSSQSDEED